jgi:hypothetical protein
MTSEADLVEAARALLGDEEILAAGVFGLQDDYAALAVAGVASGVATEALEIASPTLDAAAGVGAMHATRKAVAASKGLTVAMLVAVSASTIHVLSWEGGRADRELMAFDRASSTVQVTKFGLSRHLNLADETGQGVGLTGSTAFFSAVSAGDKLVLHLLTAP